MSGFLPSRSVSRPKGAFSTTRAAAGAASTNPTPDAPRPNAAAYSGRIGTIAPKPKFNAALAHVTTAMPLL